MKARKVCSNPVHRSKILLEHNRLRELQKPPSQKSLLQKLKYEISDKLVKWDNNIYEVLYVFKHPNRYYQHDENYQSGL